MDQIYLNFLVLVIKHVQLIAFNLVMAFIYATVNFGNGSLPMSEKIQFGGHLI